MEGYLKMDVVTYRGVHYKAHEIIDHLSNKFGGSHYGTKVPEFLAEMNSFELNNQPLLFHLVVQIADLFLQLGSMLIRKISTFEFFATLQFEDSSPTKNYLLDFVLPRSSCRISLYAQKTKIGIFLCDVVGRNVNHEIQMLRLPRTLGLVSISHCLTVDFKSKINVSINGFTLFNYSIEDPLLMINDLLGYYRYFNRSLENRSQDFEFGLAEHIGFDKIIEDVDRENLNSYMYFRKGKGITWFNKHNSGYVLPEQTSMRFEGKAELRKFRSKWRVVDGLIFYFVRQLHKLRIAWAGFPTTKSSRNWGRQGHIPLLPQQ